MSNSIFDWITQISSNVWLYGGTFLLVLGILVFVHEWGHYMAARINGVKIDSFSIGFGPELFGYTDKRGTRWKFSLIPLGGYVKMFGDVDPASARHAESVKDGAKGEIRPMNEEEKSVAFYTQSVGKRAFIVFAGPAINFLFAIFIMFCLYTLYGKPITPPVATGVMTGSAADLAGFQPHDEILSIDGKKIERFEDIRREVLVGLDKKREFVIRRDGQTIELTAEPKRVVVQDHFGFQHSMGILGIVSTENAIQISTIKSIDETPVSSAEEAREILLARMGETMSIRTGEGEDGSLTVRPDRDYNAGLTDPGSAQYNVLVLNAGFGDLIVKLSPWKALTSSVTETYQISASTLDALGQILTGTRSATELGGIIRIGAVAGDMAKAGLLALISFTALLSINLGLVNLFPIPMLDGGHLVFYGIEAVKGAPISENVQEYAFRIGLALLVGLMLFANLNDIFQLAR